MTDMSLQEFDLAAYQVSNSDHDISYYNFHRLRYHTLVQFLLKYHSTQKFKKILDIGASFQTRFIDLCFDDIQLDTMGFTLEKFKPVINSTTDIEFDLTRSGTDESALDAIRSRYDLIILAEVIEHMYIRPERVLSTLQTLLKPGGLLLLQTPNAAFLGNRAKLLLGKNPFPWIRDDPKNPGHYREYTKQELIWLAKETGYTINSISGHNYFDHSSRIKSLSLRIISLFPDTFQNGFTMVLQKPLKANTIS